MRHDRTGLESSCHKYAQRTADAGNTRESKKTPESWKSESGEFESVYHSAYLCNRRGHATGNIGNRCRIQSYWILRRNRKERVDIRRGDNQERHTETEYREVDVPQKQEKQVVVQAIEIHEQGKQRSGMVCAKRKSQTLDARQVH